MAKRGRPRKHPLPDGDGKRKVLAPNVDHYFSLEKGDVAKYITHAKGLWDLPPIDLQDDKQITDRIQWFFEYCAKADMKPSMSGLAMALGVDSRTLRA